MQDVLWQTRASSLLEVFQAACGYGSASSIGQRSASPSFSRNWPLVVARLTAVEAAMLQDFQWWGPQMEDRLKCLATEGSDTTFFSHSAS
jgi:hypothetical protein